MPAKFRWTIKWGRLILLLVLLLAPFVAHSLRAATPAGAPDVRRIDAFVRTQVQRHGLPGLALGLVEGDQIIHLAGYGRADQTGRPVTPQTPFVLASVSKPITALAVMQLVERGQLELDAPVQRYLPNFRVADPVASQQITVRHLLNHTSGIPEQGCRSRAGAKTLEQFVTELQTVELIAPVGARHFYCSGNYNVLGRIIEVASGQSFASYVEGRLFAPLAMQHSFTTPDAAQHDGLAHGHHWLFGLPLPTDFPHDAAQLPSGFLMASAVDLAHFLIAQLNEGRFGATTILSPAGIALMQAGSVPIGPGRGEYGLGWVNRPLGGVATLQHAGDHPNFHALLLIQPETRRGAVLLVNGQNMLAQFGAFQEIETGVARLLAGQEPTPSALPSLPTLYLVIDVLLGALLALALWPLWRLRGWQGWLAQQQEAGRLPRRRIGLRVVWEIGLPVTLLVGVRLLLAGLGAESWQEGLLLFPDFGVWLWTVCLVLLLTGLTRLVLVWRVLRPRSAGAQ